MGEDHEGVWSRWHLDRVLEVEPLVWRAYDAWSIDPDRRASAAESSLETDALLTLRNAAARAAAPKEPDPDSASKEPADAGA
jgi:hypothetical protein